MYGSVWLEFQYWTSGSVSVFRNDYYYFTTPISFAGDIMSPCAMTETRLNAVLVCLFCFVGEEIDKVLSLAVHHGVIHLPVVVLASVGFGMSRGMGSLGMLHLRGLYWYSVVDHGNVLAVPVGGVRVTSVPVVSSPVTIIPSSGTRLGLSDGGEMGGLGVSHFGSIGGNSSRSVSVSLSLSNRGKVHSLSVGDFGSVHNTAIGSKRSVGVDGSVGGLSSQGPVVSGKVLSLGSLNLRGVQRNSVVDEDWGRGSVPSQGALVQAVSETSVGGKVLSLGGLNFGGVLRNACDSSVSGQVSSTSRLHLGSINGNAIVSDHDWSSDVVLKSGSPSVRPGSAVRVRYGVQDLRLVGNRWGPATQTGSYAQGGYNLQVGTNVDTKRFNI